MKWWVLSAPLFVLLVFHLFPSVPKGKEVKRKRYGDLEISLLCFFFILFLPHDSDEVDNFQEDKTEAAAKEGKLKSHSSEVGHERRVKGQLMCMCCESLWSEGADRHERRRELAQGGT